MAVFALLSLCSMNYHRLSAPVDGIAPACYLQLGACCVAGLLGGEVRLRLHYLSFPFGPRANPRRAQF